MINSTVATLEWAAQVRRAASRMHISGSPVMAPSSTRTLGALSAGASVSSRMCSASSTSPSPMETRPRSLIRLREPLRNATTPAMNRIGATAETLNERSCTMSVVPTFAPSRIARPEARPTTPCAVNEAVMSAVAVLLCSSVVSPRPAANAAKRLPSAFDSKRRRSEPKARKMPLWIMCRPHSSSATPPIRSRSTMVPIAFDSPSRPSVRRHHYRQAGFPESSALLPAINANARTKSPRPSTNLRAHAARALCNSAMAEAKASSVKATSSSVCASEM